MLPLDSPVWSQITHAYGPASDISELLRQLAQDPRPNPGSQAEPWYSLWSALCHQGDVYAASYAALPHIVDIAIKAQGPIDFSFFQLPACIEIARVNGQGPEIRPELKEAYESGISRLQESAIRHMSDEWDDAMTISVAAALAVAKGQYRLAEALIELDSEMIDRILSRDF